MRISDWSSDVCSSDLTAENPLRRSHGPELPTPTLLPICRRLPCRTDRQQGGRGEDHGRYTELPRCSAHPRRVTGENGGSRCVEGTAVTWLPRMRLTVCFRRHTGGALAWETVGRGRSVS